MAHGDEREGKWRGNWRMEWVASTLHTTYEHGVSSITTADAHTSAASCRLNWRPTDLFIPLTWRIRWAPNNASKWQMGFNSAFKGLNGVVRFAERQNLVSVRGPSHFKRSLLTWSYNTGCFKKSFTPLKAYRNLYRGHTQRFELSKCNKTHRVLPRIVMVQCDFHW